VSPQPVTRLPEHPTTKREAMEYIDRLFQADLGFHFDEPPETIVHPDGEPVFTEEEVAQLSEDIPALFSLMAEEEICDESSTSHDYCLSLTTMEWRGYA